MVSATFTYPSFNILSLFLSSKHPLSRSICPSFPTLPFSLVT